MSKSSFTIGLIVLIPALAFLAWLYATVDSPENVSRDSIAPHFVPGKAPKAQ